MQATAKRVVSTTVLFLFYIFKIQLQHVESSAFFLLSMKINYESNYILFRNEVFSDVVEGVRSKTFLGASPQTRIFLSAH